MLYLKIERTPEMAKKYIVSKCVHFKSLIILVLTVNDGTSNIALTFFAHPSHAFAVTCARSFYFINI